MDLSNDDIFKIVKIIEASGYDEVRLEVGDFKIHVRKHADGDAAVMPSGIAERRPLPSAPPPSPPPQEPPARSAAEEAPPDGAVVVRSPMLGTFYRAPSPGEKPFVEVGAKVVSDDTLCLVEVMKLFNSIKAGVSGTVVKILAENAAMVEHGQPLMYIRPD
ncbi:MAG: acetyl-CoA carboxylase biotin carboxyl carrier protein [Betaproteobacteria bacterium]|nr:acetyl-CoA carboxylase biotin carboxyl carrier protein [Betaproteobacteria bacterium]